MGNTAYSILSQRMDKNVHTGNIKKHMHTVQYLLCTDLNQTAWTRNRLNVGYNWTEDSQKSALNLSCMNGDAFTYWRILVQRWCYHQALEKSERTTNSVNINLWIEVQVNSKILKKWCESSVLWFLYLTHTHNSLLTHTIIMLTTTTTRRLMIRSDSTMMVSEQRVIIGVNCCWVRAARPLFTLYCGWWHNSLLH